MRYWIFDLDNTLYQGILRNYDQLQPAKKLYILIKNLPGKKILFTNGNGNHARLCIHRMKLYNLFDSIIHRDMVQSLKPDLICYHKMMELCNINRNDECIFFEDTAINLIVAKRLGWKTVFISPIIINNNHIDYSFSNIYVALSYFYYLINK
jgi:putative hydrolase of the HAD superfamily